MIDFSVPISGMMRAETTVNQIAERVAQPASDTVSLSADMVALMQSRNDFAVDVKLAQTDDQMTRSALSLIG
jgi:hypothetical protein